MDTLSLQQEVKMLRSALIGILGKDKEGAYRPEFVREVFEGLNRRPNKTFSDAETFLKEVSDA